MLALAAALFVVLAWRQSDAFMVWDEEVMVHSMRAPAVLASEPGPRGAPRMEPSCADATAPRFVLSSGRPRLGMCARGRLWPLMIAPYFSGIFYWPFGLLARWHHDDVLVLRKLALSLGVLSLGLTYALVRRLAGTRTAAVVALALAVSPSFVFLHAVLVHFETLPWALLCAAGLALTGGGSPAPSMRRLAAAGALLGLSVLANLKTVVLLGPLALVAWRLRPPTQTPRLRASQRAALAVAGLAPLVPMVVVYLLPANGYGDKSSGWARTLAAHLSQPGRLVPSVRDMVLWWSNVGYYFRGFVAHPRMVPAALVVAVAALVFALADGARTLLRREGDAITAACGATLAAYALMVALLYEEFPANYTPLHAVFGVTLGVFAARAGDAATRLARSRWAGAAVVALLLAPFAASTQQLVETSRAFQLRTNLVTVRAVVAYLRAHPGPAVMTVDPRLAGVLDATSRGAVRTVQAHNFVQACRPREGNADAARCLAERWPALLAMGTGTWRVVLPRDAARWHSGQLDLGPSLEAAARAMGREAVVEQTFVTAGGLPAVALYRVDPR